MKLREISEAGVGDLLSERPAHQGCFIDASEPTLGLQNYGLLDDTVSSRARFDHVAPSTQWDQRKLTIPRVRASALLSDPVLQTLDEFGREIGVFGFVNHVRGPLQEIREEILAIESPTHVRLEAGKHSLDRDEPEPRVVLNAYGGVATILHGTDTESAETAHKIFLMLKECQDDSVLVEERYARGARCFVCAKPAQVREGIIRVDLARLSEPDIVRQSVHCHRSCFKDSTGADILV